MLPAVTNNPQLSVPLHNSLFPTKSLGDAVLWFESLGSQALTFW